MVVVPQRTLCVFFTFFSPSLILSGVPLDGPGSAGHHLGPCIRLVTSLGVKLTTSPAPATRVGRISAHRDGHLCLTCRPHLGSSLWPLQAESTPIPVPGLPVPFSPRWGCGVPRPRAGRLFGLYSWEPHTRQQRKDVRGGRVSPCWDTTSSHRAVCPWAPTRSPTAAETVRRGP